MCAYVRAQEVAGAHSFYEEHGDGDVAMSDRVDEDAGGDRSGEEGKDGKQNSAGDVDQTALRATIESAQTMEDVMKLEAALQAGSA